MNNEKRFILFIVLMIAWMWGFPHIMRLLGLAPPPTKKPPENPPAAGAEKKDGPADTARNPGKAAVAKEEGKAKDEAKAKDEGKAKDAPASKPEKTAGAEKKADVAVVPASELVLGSETDKSPGGYRLEARLSQKGAGITSLTSSRWDAEYDNNKAIKRPLQLLDGDYWPASLSMTLGLGSEAPPPVVPEGEESPINARGAEDWLDSTLWEVVPGEGGKIRRPASVIDPASGAKVDGEEMVFRTTSPSGVVVTKTFRLGKGIDGLEMELKFESPGRDRKVVYNLMGPHGIPIEGEWYTGTFLDLVFGPISASGTVDVVTTSAYDIANAGDKLVENTTLPLRFAGVEDQYFAALITPVPPPTGPDNRWDDRTVAMAHKRDDSLQKSDIAFRMTSKPIPIAAGGSVSHTYRLFAGPKTSEALQPYGAEGLATYRKNQWVPFAPVLARAVITPTLDFMYRLTQSVANLFGWKNGNYGIAIILLTMAVRAMMFPLGRKQAMTAQKMQALQPHLKAIQEKYKDDKEQLTRETFALYKKYGANPMSGCIPALVQIPIFVGLWQALNTSVPLRHATFLWINDLAAPDMMFKFPVEIPFLGEWFNLLPFLVIALMIIQTQLFAPPATTPEAEQSQKMMKYMMVFMGVMFYKVPSGLGIYFITSSLWALGERLLLPKLTHAELKPVDGSDAEEDSRSGSRGGPKGGSPSPRGGKNPPTVPNVDGKRSGKFAQFWERVLEEARKDTTYRKGGEEREPRDRDKEKGDPRPRPRRR